MNKKRFLNFMDQIIWFILGAFLLVVIGRKFIMPLMISYIPINEKKQITTYQAGEVVTKKEVPVKKQIRWDLVDKEIERVLIEARLKAEAYAGKELDIWIETLQERIDKNFIEWYFGYFTQQQISYKYLTSKIKNVKLYENFFGEQPEAIQVITEDIQQEFANRVLRPEISQLKIEKITRDTVDIYLYEIARSISDIPIRYEITRADWESYLNQISVLTRRVNGNREVEIPLKVVVLGGLSSVLVVSKLGVDVGTKVMMKKALTTSARTGVKAAASKGGTKVAAKYGGKLGGPLVAVGVVLWEIRDHQNVKKEGKPIMRRNLQDYLQELKVSLLEDETGIMSIIEKINYNIYSSFQDIEKEGEGN